MVKSDDVLLTTLHTAALSPVVTNMKVAKHTSQPIKSHSAHLSMYSGQYPSDKLSKREANNLGDKDSLAMAETLVALSCSAARSIPANKSKQVHQSHSFLKFPVSSSPSGVDGFWVYDNRTNVNITSRDTPETGRMDIDQRDQVEDEDDLLFPGKAFDRMGIHSPRVMTFGQVKTQSDAMLKKAVSPSHEERDMQMEITSHNTKYNSTERARAIARYLDKRTRRVWSKKVDYGVRKSFADSRLRVKGRFVKKEDEALLKEMLSLV